MRVNIDSRHVLTYAPARAGLQHIELAMVSQWVRQPIGNRAATSEVRLLRLRRERPRQCAAETDNELPSLHARSDLKTTVSLSKLDT